MMKRVFCISNFRRAAGLVACIIILGVLLNQVSHIVERKTSTIKYTPFFEEKNDFDVLFIGSSHVVNGIFPMELWSDYGIISYNFGAHGSGIPASYWTMQNALDYTNPRLIVFDCWGIESDEKFSKNKHLHYSLDAFPLSITKIRGINDIFKDDKMSKLEMTWDYATYHARWSQLEKEDFDVEYTKEKGAESRVGVYPVDDWSYIDDGLSYEGDSLGTEYLIRVIETCKRKDIDLLLIYLPFPASIDQQHGANRAHEIAEKYDIDYINMLNMELVNKGIDYCDESHLNPSGAKKVTAYLGRYITENYGLTDHRKDEKYKKWIEDLREYESYKKELLEEADNLAVYLSLAADKGVTTEIKINNKDIYKCTLYVELLENLGLSEEEITQSPETILIRNGDICIDNDKDVATDLDGMNSDLDILIRDRVGNTIDRVGFTYDVYADGNLIMTGIYR